MSAFALRNSLLAFCPSLSSRFAFGIALSYCSSKNDCTQLCFMALRRYGTQQGVLLVRVRVRVRVLVLLLLLGRMKGLG
ncbi:GH10898 [Drosophila grimshawi]|uniref:GH10898 n=1 Tax=Drosophila grimshawi TaxID=7222 RepID=B4JAM6_DROGR|nr:GH10898 [Drosophila grimshawi]